jgi:hypothetical protein
MSEVRPPQHGARTRGIALDAAIFNAVFSAPVGATLAWGVFFALAAFPGADLVTATLIAFALNIPLLIMMSLLASSMPRTGGDYVWVSRILSPPLAVVSNFGAAFCRVRSAHLLRCAILAPRAGHRRRPRLPRAAARLRDASEMRR